MKAVVTQFQNARQNLINQLQSANSAQQAAILGTLEQQREQFQQQMQQLRQQAQEQVLQMQQQFNNSYGPGGSGNPGGGGSHGGTGSAPK